MPTKFLESLGGKLAEQWLATLLTPAFVFWMGGLGAWVWRFGWTNLETWFGQQSQPLQIALLVGSLLIVATSAVVVQRFDLQILRFLEGYWLRWMRPLRRPLIQQQKNWVKRTKDRFRILAQQDRRLTVEEQNERAMLDWQLIHTPAQSVDLMPTRLGNILRAAESRPGEKYGLDAVICWPRLWLLFPEDVKTELQQARADLNTAARIWLWSILFLTWVIWAWWAIPIGLLFALVAYRWLLDAAVAYGDLLESAFDLYRLMLYQALHWPLPPNPAEERHYGEQLTQYLWRGSDQPQPNFTSSEKPEK